ncbi:Uncharacterised protein g9231 [Pycnogonum litorale]
MLTKTFILLVAAAVVVIAVDPHDGNGKDKYPKRPYQYGYQVKHYDDTEHGKQEEMDITGKVTGSFYITIPYFKTMRKVSYVATHDDGIKFYIETNEPGVGDEPSADVDLTVKPPPPGVYSKKWKHHYEPKKPDHSAP